MQPHGDPPDVDALVAELQERVAARRQAGEYPADLEHRLRDHERRIIQFRHAPDLEPLGAALARLDEVGGFSQERIPTESRMPGGRALHETVGKVVARQTAGVLQQMQEFGDTVREALRHILALIEDPSHVHADLVSQIDALYDQAASFERGPTSPDAAVADLRHRMERLEEAERRRGFRPFYGNAAFEEQFRGTRAELLAHYDSLAEDLRGHGPVLDIGCGRGEFLELLRDKGVEARGVEIDPDLVDDCVTRGLNVTLGDGLAELTACGDGELGGVVLIHVVEHLTPQQVLDVAELAYAKIRPGGRALMETVNPQSLAVFARAFFIDPTHSQPIHPAYLDFILRQAGFEVRTEWRSPPPANETLTPVDESAPAAETINANVARLNDVLFAPQDYAVIATR